MTAFIAHFLRRSTGPLRMRAELRRMTMPLRSFHTAVEPLGHVGGTIPRTVLGGDLVALLSGRLRALIEDGVAMPQMMVDTPTTRPEFEPRLPTEGDRTPLHIPTDSNKGASWTKELPGRVAAPHERSFAMLRGREGIAAGDAAPLLAPMS